MSYQVHWLLIHTEISSNWQEDINRIDGKFPTLFIKLKAKEVSYSLKKTRKRFYGCTVTNFTSVQQHIIKEETRLIRSPFEDCRQAKESVVLTKYTWKHFVVVQLQMSPLKIVGKTSPLHECIKAGSTEQKKVSYQVIITYWISSTGNKVLDWNYWPQSECGKINYDSRQHKFNLGSCNSLFICMVSDI